ncbi:MAG: hypothetical protein ACPL6D_15685 [Thermodesulfobacteriota bacterium]
MRNLIRIWVIVFIILVVMATVQRAFTQEKYSVLVGKVLVIEMRRWMEVENEQDKSIVNFRIGRKTIYTPHRYPLPGERVKVEYLFHRGVPVAYRVTILGHES